MPHTSRGRAERRDDFLSALTDYIDARIHRASADPEWRSEPTREREALELALEKVLEHDRDTPS